ncbi:MAG: glycyl radical protein [Calditrichia bacterium]
MTERIQKLRNQTLETKPEFSAERAQLLTEFYQNGMADKVSMPMARALAFKYIMEHKALYLGEGELIVGERGPAPKATPSYPEVCVHSLEDLDILHNRPKISFSVSEEVRDVYKDQIIPFWKGRSMRDRIFSNLDQEWKDAYEAGVFTEFLEQRAPGHTVLDDKIYRKGMLDFKKDIEQSIAELDFYNDPEALDKKEELQAMSVAIDGILILARRYADYALELAEKETDPVRKEELVRIASNCNHVPAYAPRDIWEALQYYWFIHLGVITELNTWDSFNPGRLDQHLYPFYQSDLENGKFDKDFIKELLMAFWVKFNNQPAPPKVGVTALESNTYTDFALINLGGLTPEGENAVNELSYLLLDVIEEMRILQPSSMVQISKKTPDRFLKRALKIVKTGFGQPSIFNTDAIIQEMLRQGKDIIDARCGGASGCVETGAFGKEAYFLTGYFNLPKVLEITLNNGVDPLTGKQIGIKTGDPLTFEQFSQLFEAFEHQLHYFIDIKIKGNRTIERLYAKYLPAPFLSVLIDDCIATGKDYHDGGARYNTSYIQGVGMGTITDSLSAIKYHVYDQKTCSFDRLLKALDSNFDSDPEIRELLWADTPKYGNDDDRADAILKQVFESFFDSVDGRPTARGGYFRINLLPTTVHVYFGSKLGATPDGRYQFQPLSEGISPVQGADKFGPTAVIKSAAKIDHLRTGGTLLNQKFTPQLLSTEEGIKKLAGLVRAYFYMDGHHIQFNVVSADTLRRAKKHPEEYKYLIVRVAGYSDYFVDLTPELQDEIIRRTEHLGF